MSLARCLLVAAVASARAYDIEHVVVLVFENRPFDHVYGFAQRELPGINGLTGDEYNFYDPNDPSKGKVGVKRGGAPYVCTYGPSHSFASTCIDNFGLNATCASGPYPPTTQSGFLYEAQGHEEVMWQFSPEQLPVKMALAAEFALMDAYHASFPGPSTPQHLFIMSATSAGCTNTEEPYRCQAGRTYPQKTVFQNLLEANKTFAYYYNDTAWNTFLEFFNTKEGAAGVQNYDAFYHAAKTGTLPNFAFMLPREGTNATTGEGSNDDHPCHDVALGEKLLKDTYEALRAGPAWNRTLLIVTYDDAGGFYDHAPLPTEGVPPPDDVPSCSSKTAFDYLGNRLPTLLISPWVAKGAVIHDPPGEAGTVFRPEATSKFEHSSISSTLKHLFGLPAFLTRRDAWAAPLTSALTEAAPRTDTMLHTPEPPKPSSEAAVHSCGDPEKLTRRQLRRIRSWEARNQVEAPLADLNPVSAEGWLAEQQQAHHARVLASGQVDL